MASPVASRSHSPSSVSGSSSSSGSSSPARGVYVPLHKRSAPSSATSVSAESESSSHPCSSSRHRSTKSPAMEVTDTYPRIYTTGYLLSLRSFATEGLKAKMRESCPEVVMNRRMRKSIEFNENQARSAMKREHQQHASPILPPSLLRTHAPEDLHLDIQPLTVIPTHTAPRNAIRVTPRRSRPTGRAPERMRQALTHEPWHGLRNTGNTMPLVSV